MYHANNLTKRYGLPTPPAMVRLGGVFLLLESIAGSPRKRKDKRPIFTHSIPTYRVGWHSGSTVRSNGNLQQS